MLFVILFLIIIAGYMAILVLIAKRIHNKPKGKTRAIIVAIGVVIPLMILGGLFALEFKGMENTKSAIIKYAESKGKFVSEYKLCDQNGNLLDRPGRRDAANRLFTIIWRYRVVFGKNDVKIVTVGMPFLGEYFGDVTQVKDLNSG